MSSAKPIIFISYAHADEPEKPRGEEVQWLSFVMRFLRPAVKSGAFTMWVDRQMPGGTEWDEEIDRELRACDVFVLLVSASSMGSDYIIDKELEIARARRATGELYIYPLLIRPTPREGLDRVREFNLRPRDAKPFSSYSLNDLEQHMSDAADEIADVAKGIAGKKAAAAAEQAQLSKLAETARIAAAIAGQKAIIAPSPDSAKSAPIGPAVAPPVLVDISGLPETFYERLVGRDAELARLDKAWSDKKTNILSLVAEGGAGKSALVNEWLTRLRADGYRGATRVLGWSFYSQGSKERATAADEFLNWALDKLKVKIETNSASAKGEAIAEALTNRRVLLVLDGVEPLQHGPGPQTGQLKDQGLRALLRRFAAASPRPEHSLIVLTSRLAVADLKRFRDGAAPVVDLERLSDEAGAELLRDSDVWGIDKELRAASRDFGGHPLALTLLASLLKETQNGDVRRRDHLRSLLADADNPGHDHARRVMESYEKEWLAEQPVLLAILHCVGLFDRPASGDCLKALRAKPAIRGLTDDIVNLDETAWRRAVSRLREVRLLAPVDPSDPEALDAHPLVREWFGERLKTTNEAAWKAAHSRLYDHLRRTTREGETASLADLAPLYQAVGHGCRAGRYQEALDTVYFKRVCRVRPNGEPEFYAHSKLGATGSNLATISLFFDRPYETPVDHLTPRGQVFVVGEAGVGLRAQGHLNDALPPMRAALGMYESMQSWKWAAAAASNLSETEREAGDVEAAKVTAKKSLVLADRAQDATQKAICLITYGEALQVAGDLKKAEDLFAEAERGLTGREPRLQLPFPSGGYHYYDLLLAQEKAAEVRDQTAQELRDLKNLGLLDLAKANLGLGRALLALASSKGERLPSPENSIGAARTAGDTIQKAVELLQAAADRAWVPRGLIARAAFRRVAGDFDGARRDLDEVEEIAEPGPMRLHLCDIALERARIALARREAFAPL
ncbi:MAG: TIR domain-containing protein, partial [Roseiarcus sp.]